MSDKQIISDVAAQIAAGREALRELERSVAKVAPEAARPIDVCRLKGAICELIGIVDRVGEAVVDIDRRLTAAAELEAKEAARKAEELNLAPLPDEEVSAKDGRSIQRRCTEALFAGRQPAT